MPSLREPLDWYIEVCAVCGCQLGPGIGSRTRNGRCLVEEHHGAGGIVVRVVGRIDGQQEAVTQSSFGRIRARGIDLPTEERARG